MAKQMPAKIAKAEEFKACRMVYIVVDAPGVQHSPRIVEVLQAAQRMIEDKPAMRILRMGKDLDLIRIDLIPGPMARLTLKRKKG